MKASYWLRHRWTFLWAALAMSAINGLGPAARAAEVPKNDAAAKQAIFASTAFQQAMAELNVWFSVQVIYDQREVPQLKRELVERLDKMTAAELQNYLADLQQRIAIMASPEAVAVRSYIAHNLSVASDAYAAKMRRELPNVLNMNAAQLKQALFEQQQKQAATKASEEAFQQQRQTQLKLVQQWNQQTAEASAAAAAQMNSRPASGGFIPPPTQNPIPTYNPRPIITSFDWYW